ncbi:MAG: nucleotidyltransferase domain-containing protein [Candidatus Lindowbacteria bacterium]|nr:nucleotidyltransferase domain-containing protein [Candidatus Lindowbacteria bacterium]
MYQRSGGNKLVTGSEEIRETIRDMVEKIVQGYQPKKIILFGSFAYGQPSEDSDIDLFIIKNTDQKPIERWTEIKRLLRDLSHSVPVAPLVYTEQELEARRAIKDFFVEEILEKGEVLYEG